MKSSIRSILPILLLAALAPLRTALAANPGDELLPNGNFEGPAPGGKAPASWSWGGGFQWATDGRNHWLVEEATTPASLSAGQRVPMGEGFWKIRVSCRVKVTDVKQGQEGWNDARLAMDFHNEKGEMVGAWPNVLHFTGTMKDWETHSRDYIVPPGAAYLNLSCSLFSTTGKVEWDDVSVKLLKFRPVPEDAKLPEGVVARWDLASAVREETPTRGRVCINGLWRFHPVALGEPALPAAGTGWGYLKVPGTWAPGVSRQRPLGPDIWEENLDLNKIDAAWYQRAITIPPEWTGRRVFVNLDNPKQSAKVLIDGKPAGKIEWPGGRVDVTALVTPGKTHELSVCTLALPIAEEQILVMGPDKIEQARAEVRFKGLCGDGWLESEPAGARVTDVFVKPSVERWELGLRCELADLKPDQHYRLRARVLDGDQVAKEFASAEFAGSQALTFAGQWRNPKLWDLDQPNLYTVSVTLEDISGKRLDETTPVRFGFREFRIQGRDFILNGTRVHFRCLDYSNAGSDFGLSAYAQVRRTFAQARRLGFNYVIHSHYDYEPQSFAYIDDTLRAGDDAGFPMSYSIRHISSIFRDFDNPEKRAPWNRVVEYEVRRVRNHPSVFMYAMNHNFTGWADDQNPMQLDGRFEPSAADNPWLAQVRHAATESEQFVMSLDGTRPCYHHQSGSFNQMITLNCYLNFTPLQERMEWISKWRSEGVKPLFFVEFGLPHQASWGGHREGPFIWRNNVNSEPFTQEFGAIYNGDDAYKLTDYDRKNIDTVERVYAQGKPFHISQVLGAYWDNRWEHNFIEIKSLFTSKTWPAFRTYGISAILPWDQADLFKPMPNATGQDAELKTDWEKLQRPGLSPDYVAWNTDWLTCPEPEGHLEPTSLGRTFARVNRETLAYLAGPPERFTAQDHVFTGGETIAKQVIVINDLRREAAIEYLWTARLNGKFVEFGSGQGTAAPGDKFVAPVKFRAPEVKQNASGSLELSVTVNGKTDETLQDAFSFTVLPPTPPVQLPAGAKIACYDPKGLTSQLLHAHNVPFQPVAQPVAPAGCTLFIVGREAMTPDGPALDAEALMARGVTVLIFEQAEQVLQTRWGFRTASPGTRRVFTREPGHPILTGLGVNDDLLRDWRGSSTLVEAYPKRVGYFNSYPRTVWCGFNDSRTWKWGNEGCVASVLIEKPQRGNWSFPLDCEFDLQYAPLAEWLTPQGRTIFCQLDLTGRDTTDPVAERLFGNLLRYAASPPAPRVAPATYLGNDATCQVLTDLGADLTGGETVIIGRGADPQAALAAIKPAKTVICLALTGQEISALLPGDFVTEKRDVVSTIINRPGPGPLFGLGKGDFHWRGRISVKALTKVPSVYGDPTGGLVASGPSNGKQCVLVQFLPSDFDTTTKPYLKLSHRRAAISLARILTNCGVSLSAPVNSRLASPAPTALDLSGPWRFRTDPSAKLTMEEVERLAGDANGWRTATVPGMWEEQFADLKDYDGIAWYRRTFTMPDPLPGAEITLRLSAVDDEDWTYLNGKLVGHIGRETNPDNYWSAPRDYRLPPGALRPGENVLLVKVNDLRQSGGFAKGPVGLFEPGRWLGSYYLDQPIDLDDPYRYNRW